MPGRTPVHARARSRLLATIALVMAASAPGCIGTPIEKKGQRSQYDRHEALRGNLAEPYVEDEFGRMIPNLRARLLSKE